MKDKSKKKLIQLGKKDIFKSKEDIYIGLKIKHRALYKIKLILKIPCVSILIKRKNL